MRLPEIWDDWVVYDDKGICGIREDAPEDVKNAFEKWLSDQENLKSQHTKI